jgi:hypothetical protein
MPLLNIEELKTKNIVKGASCPHCGGELILLGDRQLLGKLFKVVTLGFIKLKRDGCNRTIHVF